MADFTLNGPGTTNDPWTAPGIIMPVGSLRSDATGFFCGTSAPGYCVFAHNANYGSTITATCTFSATLDSDDVILGAVVRSGSNASALIGLWIQSGQVTVVTLDN